MSKITLVKKMSGKSFGPKQILGQPASVKELALGVVIGVVTGITKSELPDGQIAEGFKGQFLFKSAQPDHTPDVRSGIFWQPSGFMEDMLALMKSENAPATAEFCYTVGVKRAENPAGYEWFLEPLIAPSESDPLEALTLRLGDKLPAPAAVAKVEKAKG